MQQAETAAAAETLSVTAESAAALRNGQQCPPRNRNIRNRLTADAFATPAPSPIADRQKRLKEQRFLPTRKRIDREINKLKFAYKAK